MQTILPNLEIYKKLWLYNMTMEGNLAMKVEDQLAVLNTQVAKLEERVYENHSEAIGDAKTDLNNLNNKLSIVILLMIINAFMSGASNWEKLISIIKG